MAVEVIGPDGRGYFKPLIEICDFIVQPALPWFSLAERVLLERTLYGDFETCSSDEMMVGRIEGQIVGTAWYHVGRENRAVGAMGYVFTSEEHRGKGVSSCLVQVALARFKKGGGRCMYLGTGNPAAHHVYGKYGFRDYNGHVMRYLTESMDDEAFDRVFFANTGRALVRDAHWGDLSACTALCAAPHPWFVKDYREALFSHPALTQTRCVSVFPSMMLSNEQTGNALLLLESPANRIVGAARITHGDAVCQRHVAELEFTVYPTYQNQITEFLHVAIDRAVGSGVRVLRTFSASCDEERRSILEEMGFTGGVVLEDQLKVGQEVFDLEIHRYGIHP